MTASRIGRITTVCLVSMFALLPTSAVHAQGAESTSWAVKVGREYRVTPNVTYLTAGQWEGKADLYLPREGDGPHPTFVYFHSGAHVRGSKESSVLALLPYLEMGWAVVNVAYRLGPVAHAPAAVEDCLCAARWVIEHAEEYGLDPNRIVATGASAGSHLALTTAMIPSSAGLDRQCPGAPIELAAVVNWYGITDVLERLVGQHSQSGTVQWFGSNPDREELATFISPLTYIREGVPPVITIHGDADPRIPHTQAVRLHQGLERAGVPNELVTIPGGGHGGFPQDQMERSHAAIRAFLAKHVMKSASASQ